MEKISLKKELYFMRYSISKHKDFSRIFFNFFRDFFDFEHTYKNTTSIFKVEIYKNVPLIFKGKFYKNAPLIF